MWYLIIWLNYPKINLMSWDSLGVDGHVFHLLLLSFPYFMPSLKVPKRPIAPSVSGGVIMLSSRWIMWRVKGALWGRRGRGGRERGEDHKRHPTIGGRGGSRTPGTGTRTCHLEEWLWRNPGDRICESLSRRHRSQRRCRRNPTRVRSWGVTAKEELVQKYDEETH